MNLRDFDYHLPEELIAQTPLAKRDQSCLLVLDKLTGKLQDSFFKEILNYLEPGDLLVLNNSRVIPARLYGEKIPTGTKIEVLLLTEKAEGLWQVLLKPARRVKKGTSISFADKMIGKVVDYTDFGARIMEFEYQGNFNEIINKLGQMPLPPYIKEKLDNPERYQTVYAAKEGSVAAPTAGLHFTPQLLKKIKNKGINIAEITLHVGLGTFRPVKEEKISEHKMHSEYYEINTDTVTKIKETKAKGKKVIAVGTTATRVLETVGAVEGDIKAKQGWTDIFIYPGFNFKIIDGLITNFHLPKSTLLMLVSALAGRDNILNAYQHAIDNNYRFYSLGDAMLII